jgi:hypothetical protein
MKINSTLRYFSILLLTLVSFLYNESSAQSCTPSGNPSVYGTKNTWIGYMYRGVNFNTYRGSITAGNPSSPNFNLTFNGSQVNFPTSGCPVYTDTFSVRFRLTKTFNNEGFEITVGGDDGYRLSIDGGNTWIINKWNEQSYNTTSVAVLLNGTVNLVLEYFEKYGENRISFAMNSTCVGSANENVFGTGGPWRGYIYQGTNFNIFKGVITRGDVQGNFNEVFGSSNGTFNTDACFITTEKFSARFKSTRTFTPGTYVFTVGGDDGYRLSLDGGNTWVINRWNDQSYGATTYTTSLSGTVNMVLEYYENGGDNRLSFNVTGGTLPITLSSWKGNLESNNNALLSWSVSDAINFNKFRLERSSDARNFAGIYEETYNSAKKNYSYIDRNISAGVVYYRLAMIDLDGTVRYSSVIIVSNSKNSDLSVFPTIITNHRISVRGNRNLSNAKFELLTMNGQVLLSEKIQSNNGSFDKVIPSNIPSTMYVVRITDGSNILLNQKLVIK